MGLTMDEQHYCQHCDSFVSVSVRREFEVYPVNGEPTWIIANVCHCSICGNSVWDNHLDSENIQRAYKRFMKKHGLRSMDEVREYKMEFKILECDTPNKNGCEYSSEAIQQTITNYMKSEQS